MHEDLGSEERERKKPQVPILLISDVWFPVPGVGWQGKGPFCKTGRARSRLASASLGFGCNEPAKLYPGHFPTEHP